MNKPSKKTLREKAGLLPDKPGVYLWLDSHKNILYVGKAKNLRIRVLSYFRDDGDSRHRLPWLMSKAADIDYIVTDSEIEALVTEANLARAKKPKYNVRLKDDKRYPYIKITKEKVPRIFLTRTIREDGSRYLGPYTDVKAVRRTLELVQSIFPLRLCSQKLPSKLVKRACLNYQIKRCSGPCMRYISMSEYNSYVEDAYHFIQGHNNDLISDLKKRMKKTSDALRYEHAAELRDRIKALQKVGARRRAFSTARLTGDWDVVNYHIVDSEACVVVMDIREGNILGKKDYLMSGVQYTSPREMLSVFLTQYYLRTTWLPSEIHLPVIPEDVDNILSLLSERRKGKVNFVYPKRGEKARLLKMTSKNAKLIMIETLEKRDRIKGAIPRTIMALKRDMKLKNPPRTIACIDISHLHGTGTAASIVFFRDGKPEKKEYRHYKITTVEGIDDFKSMREVVERYFSRCRKENREVPDLLLVDGGKGQLSSAREVLNRLGFQNQPVAGLAKRLEEVFLPGATEAQNIPRTSSSLHLLQRIRDEAHRFAVTYQKKLSKKRTITSKLNEIEGIGPVMTQSLLKHFGSVAEIEKVDVGTISQVPGIGMKRAHVINNHLNKTM
ncbi:excinuclease ABC subunit UvrC [Candidatus Latescibacterota bacterium]